MLKILVVFGTRPEAIKMCPVVAELKKHKDISSYVCLTGQHKEMLDQVMQVFQIKADHNMEIMQPKQSLSTITASVLKGMDAVIDQKKPDLVLVHGDTSSSFAAALSAFYHHIPIGHVEAGLRTYDMQAPYPEEFNRQSVDLISKLFFAPTNRARENLEKEGRDKSKIFVTGNTVIDALKTTVHNDYMDPLLEWAKGSRLILLTVHRRENIGEAMENIFKAVRRIVDGFKDVKVIYPIHKNPKVREVAEPIFRGEDRIKLIEPLDVFDFHNFMAHSYFIMTDSGGIQEEAPSLGKPVLVLRNRTERPEGIRAGTLKLIGTEFETVYEETKRMLTDEKIYREMSRAVNPYGDGHASERIVKIILDQFVCRDRKRMGTELKI